MSALDLIAEHNTNAKPCSGIVPGFQTEAQKDALTAQRYAPVTVTIEGQPYAVSLHLITPSVRFGKDGRTIPAARKHYALAVAAAKKLTNPNVADETAPQTMNHAQTATAAMPTTATATVEALLTFIADNASEEVFEQAQALEMMLSLNLQGAEAEIAEAKNELKELKEELTDGHALASYATELGKGDIADFVSSLLDNYTIKTTIEAEMKDELKRPDTIYLEIAETADIMQSIMAPRLAELITKLGIEESLRLLELA